MSTEMSRRLASLCFYGPVVAGFYFITIAIFNGKGLFGFLILCVSAGAAFMLFMQVNEIEKRELKKQRKLLASFKMGEIDAEHLPTIISSDALTRVVIDEKKSRLYVWLAVDGAGVPLKKAVYTMEYRFFEYPFEDLQAVAVIIDGSVHLSREYRLNAVMSNFINEDTGSVNSVITNAIPNDKVRKMTLMIQTNNEKHPIYPIRLYSDPYAYVEKASSDYVKTLEIVKMWFDRLDAVISETERKTAVAAGKGTAQPKVAVPAGQPAVLGRLARVAEIEAEKEVVEEKDAQPAESAMNPMEKKDGSVPVYSSEVDETKRQEASEELSREEDETMGNEELSYFEQILKKNRQQMNDSPSKKK